jgi:Na+/H+ antiporter NhaD/arsenite permease-like protein
LWLAAVFGRALGLFQLKSPRYMVSTFVVSILLSTFVIAGCLHNITAILIMVPITVTLCERYGVTSRWLLCAMLVASNLGGFSTAWGDTPNIIESATWNLTHADFAREIFPVNLAMVLLLSGAVVLLAQRSRRDAMDEVTAAGIVAGYGQERRSISIDRRLLGLGLGILVVSIVSSVLFRRYTVAIAAAAVLVAVLFERPEEQKQTLESLGFDVYITLFSVFVIAAAVESSSLGRQLHDVIAGTGGAPWAIAIAAYLGTGATEAASWAAATANSTFVINPSHAAAWALGGGVCAGSSSLITAASAGIILSAETRRCARLGDEITFGKYLYFGLPASLIMLAIYAILFTSQA